MTPAAIDAILGGVFNTVFSQYGAVFAFQMLVIGYLVRELKNERTAHDATTTQLVASAEQSTRTGVEIAETMRALKAIIEKLVDRVDNNGRFRHDR